MLPPRRSDRDDYSALKEPEQAPANHPIKEPPRPDEVRSPGWTNKAGMAETFESAEKYNKWLNEQLQKRLEGREENQSQRQPDAVNTPGPENTPQNEQKIDHKPDENVASSRPSEATADRGEDKKKAEEQEFDMERFMSDPDYRQQMKEQRHAEQQERTGDRHRGSEQVIVAEHQR
jgi:hypothetical protein